MKVSELPKGTEICLLQRDTAQGAIFKRTTVQRVLPSMGLSGWTFVYTSFGVELLRSDLELVPKNSVWIEK